MLENTQLRFTKLLQLDFTIIVLISLSFLYRTAYSVILSNQMSGQDADTYGPAAQRILEYGPFATKVGAPYWAIGYPWFISIIWKVFGVNSHVVGIVQNILLALAIFAFYKIVKLFFNNGIATITVLILIVNPALTASASLIAYESPMMSFLIFGFYFLVKASRMKESNSKNYFLSILASGICFTVSVTFQPKILLSILVIVMTLFLKSHTQTIQWKKWSGLVLILVILSTGPSAAILRNWKAGDGVGYTANFYANVQLGATNAGVKFDFSKCPGSTFDSFKRTFCILEKKLESPNASIKSAIHNGLYFWTPYVGNLKYMGTWFHGGDFRRVTPWYKWNDKTSKWYLIDRVTGYLWTFSIITLMLLGLKYARRLRPNMESIILFGSPVILLWGVSLISYGEARYRLPILPFYSVFIAVALKTLSEKYFDRRKFSDAT